MAALDGKAVVITGAGRGLGRAYALHAAANGASVVVNDVDVGEAEAVAAEIRTTGGKAIALAGSVADWATAEQVVTTCVATYGKLDGFVNNAGLYYVTDPWADDEARIRRTVEVNVVGTLFCGVHALKQMAEQGSGSLVNITSGAAAGLPRMATYAASKGAAASYTYSTALDMAKRNVRVNAVSPLGSTRMGLAREGQLSDAVELPAGATLAATGLAPEAIAPLITYLLSDRSAHVTGQVVRLQGRQLSLIEHPAIVEPGAEGDDWTTEAIAAAFDGVLRPALRPVGHAAREYRPPQPSES